MKFSMYYIRLVEEKRLITFDWGASESFANIILEVLEKHII